MSGGYLLKEDSVADGPIPFLFLLRQFPAQSETQYSPYFRAIVNVEIPLFTNSSPFNKKAKMSYGGSHL